MGEKTLRLDRALSNRQLGSSRGRIPRGKRERKPKVVGRDQQKLKFTVKRFRLILSSVVCNSVKSGFVHRRENHTV